MKATPDDLKSWEALNNVIMFRDLNDCETLIAWERSGRNRHWLLKRIERRISGLRMAEAREKRVATMAEMKASGLTLHQIALHFGVSRTRVWKQLQ